MKKLPMFFLALFVVSFVGLGVTYAGSDSVDLSSLEIKKEVVLEKCEPRASDEFQNAIGKEYYVVVKNTGQYPFRVRIDAVVKTGDFSCTPFYFNNELGEFIPPGKAMEEKREFPPSSTVFINLTSENKRIKRRKNFLFDCFGHHTDEILIPGAEGSVTIYQKPSNWQEK